MTTNQDMDVIQAVVQSYLSALQDLPPAQLQLEAGTLAVQLPAPTGLPQAQALGPGDLLDAGKTVLTRVAGVICPIQGDISGALTIANVSALVATILPALGIAGAVPGAAVAIAVLIIKIGLSQFCTQYGPK